MKEEKSKNYDYLKNQKLILKIVFILILTFLLMIPNQFVQDLIRERSHLLHNVQREVSSSWGGIQCIKGPVLAIPYSQEIKIDGKISEVKKTFYLLPDEINYRSELKTQTKKRGLYEVLLYTSDVKADVIFQIPDLINLDQNIGNIYYSRANLSLGITDPKAIHDIVYVDYNSRKYKMSMGSYDHEVIGTGVETKLTIKPEDKKIKCQISFTINGFDGLYFFPSANNTKVVMQADWGSPSFQGTILPKESSISEKGFTASWYTTEYSRNCPDLWIGKKYSLLRQSEKLGTQLIKPANEYHQNTRTAKYALLIISLTFGIFFVFEVLFYAKIHFIQYILVGFALSLFYYLLLSISEHLGFGWSYAISSYATISLICVYAYYILKEGKRIAILSGTLMTIYGYIYVILQLEEFALLAGAIGLFVILALAMFLTRNVDWNQIQKR